MKALVVAAVLVAGCTPVEMRGPSEPKICNAASLGDLVGKRASDARGDVLLARSGAATLRWLAPGTITTKEFLQERLNVHTDDKGRIIRLTCG
ncbi:peptidase inhibitor I78 [Sphingomonas ginsenosidivorax]|uniref:Peptidase inhibitor I78 n=1 Tax=Sphingomonas ginsenosidivorax TaxID=862135 RepID=A0A5C6UEX6_9SPHN|nr:I78 family peptidase inhibitor [Sphingomonas ginsenosidivorax]TXC70518.1 peptidase inhibitor I78 [Sphingomonas ginsenosidivorax]